MRVLITGATGLIGKATAERLVAGGWDVRAIDLQPSAEIAGVEYFPCDILNYNNLLDKMRGCQAVVHMAAIRGPSLAPGPKLFDINVTGTYNVFEAAAVCGIKRVAQASSINALGSYYGTVEIAPPYLPIDEAIPSNTTDPYSFSKQLVEEIGAYYWRRDGISSVAMRFPGVVQPTYITNENFLHKREFVQHMIDDLMRLPEAERRARLAEVQARAGEVRRQRPLEYHPDRPHPVQTKFVEEPLLWSYLSDRYNFWALVDVRDAAQSLEKALTADYEGAHPLYINDDHNAMGCDSRALADLFFPDVTDLRDLSGTDALVSIERARQLIGFAPEHSVAALDPS